MKVSFTQTYGDDRKHLLFYQMNDEKIVKFKNMFDVNIFSFHNCSDDVIDYFWSINKIKNVKVLRFDYESYTQCIKDLMKILKDLNTELFFFIQDDALSFNNIDYNKLLDSIEPGMFVSLGVDIKLMKSKPRNINGMFNEYWSEDFIKSNMWSYSDNPFLTSFNILESIYDDEYFNIGNIWSAELLLHQKYQGKNLVRHILNKVVFDNVNTIGLTAMFTDDPENADKVTTGLIYGDKARNIIKNRYQ